MKKKCTGSIVKILLPERKRSKNLFSLTIANERKKDQRQIHGQSRENYDSHQKFYIKG